MRKTLNGVGNSLPRQGRRWAKVGEVSQELGWEAKRKNIFRKLLEENLRVKQWWDQVLEEAERHSEVLDLVLRTKRSADDLGVQECRVR